MKTLAQQTYEKKEDNSKSENIYRIISKKKNGVKWCVGQ